MIEKVGFRVLSTPKKVQRQAAKNNANAAVLNQRENVEFAKIPVANYQVAFMGAKYNNPNSRRKYVDYGSNLYAGPQSASTNLKNPYSVDRHRAKAKKVQLDNADLSNYNFEKANFYRACLQGASLKNTNFEKANLYGVNMRGIKTEDTKFQHANLNQADFIGAKFGRRTDMSGANVCGANFYNTDLSYVNLRNSLYDETTNFPDGFNPSSKKMFLLTDGVNLSNLDKELEFAKMRFMFLHDVSFENSSLKRADLRSMDMTGGNFKNTNMSRAYALEMIARDCSFKNAKMKQTNFDGAIFENVDMSDADLRGAIFTFESAKNLNLEGTRYDQFTMFNDDFNPKAHGMVYEESNPRVYGAKTAEEIRSFREWT